MTATVSAPRVPVERNSWPRDFALGVRLAVGGGRTSWMRLILGTIGIGLAVAVLLLAASIGHIMAGRDGRTNAANPTMTAIKGVSPTQYIGNDVSYQGTSIPGAYLHGTGANSPVPPGIASLPGPNEIVVSPALANLLNSDAGAGLRGRFPQKIVGTIGEPGLRGPADLRFYAGTGPLPTTGPSAANADNVYAFGKNPGSHSIDAQLLILAIIGAVALLIPIFIFVSVSSRIAGAQRDRRLAALRLVGAGNWQVRRIAAAESLVSAGTGLVVGALAYLGIRALAPQIDFLTWSTFSDDVVPSPALAVLIVLLVPVLTVGTVLFGMRRTIIEPLGVVRGGKPVRRRVWWRLGLIVAGIALLFLAKPSNSHSTGAWTSLIAAGAAALLVGVPAILPWLLERIISRVQGGAPSWQLAIRRLQLDSGTPARVVGGVAVVLAGAIALQLLLFAAANRYNVPDSSPDSLGGWVLVNTTVAAAGQVEADLATVPAVKQINMIETVNGFDAGKPDTNDQMEYNITVVSCATIKNQLHAANCVDGDGFIPSYPGGSALTVKPGAVWNLVGAHDRTDHPKIIGQYTVPANLTPLALRNNTTPGPYFGDGVLLTPSAAAKINLPADRYTQAWVLTDPHQAGATDQIATAVAGLTWQADVQSLNEADVLTADQKTFVTIRSVLLAGSLFTLLLAGVSMLVLALEQVRERRRPLAVLAAAGVPRSALARSLLWQTAVPVVLGVIVAVGTGLGLAALVIRMTSMTMQLDWTTVGIFTGAALALVFLVTALTLPALRSAMRLSALRTE
ncbi:MAG TPA: FtsX-like permease family protein [Pseudonocardiaceae bacterium]|nr:FtsX-like permease family protein [Pseudonocardiaceae bacterium]